MKNHRFFEKVKNYLLYAGNDKEMFKQVKGQIDAANLKALRYWTVLVSFFWIYCLCMSLVAKDYKMCRPAYIISLCTCIVIYLCSRFVIPRFPNTLRLFKYLFRLSLLGGGIGIAVCQPDLRSAVAHFVCRRDHFSLHFYRQHGLFPGRSSLRACPLYPLGQKHDLPGYLLLGTGQLHVVLRFRTADRKLDQQGAF